MRIKHADKAIAKGWYLCPWNSTLGATVEYANRGIDEAHEHRCLNELYLVDCGTAEVRMEQQKVNLSAGDLLLIEPGEAHTFVNNSPNHSHFAIHTPALQSAEARSEKVIVDRSRPGLD